MRLTSFGVKAALFYLAMGGALVASPYSNLFFLLYVFLTLQGILCAAWTLSNLAGVSAALPAIEPLPAGERRTISARVQVPGRGRFQLCVELELEGGARASGQVDLAQGDVAVPLDLPALPRGLHPVRAAWLASRYPFGMLMARRAIAAPSELVVYPVPLAATGRHDAARDLAELLGEATRDRGDLQPSGLRDHREGDELRAVHWRASARRGTLVVKEWEGGGARGLELLLDRRCEPELLETSLALVSGVVALARAQKQVLALHSQGLQATFGEGHRPWSDALRFLSAADCLPADGPAPPPVSPSVTRLPLAAGHVR